MCESEGRMLLQACGMGDVDTVISLLQQGVNPDEYREPQLGWTALHKAVVNGREEVVSVLLKHGASPALQDARHNTALHWAAWGGQVGLVTNILRSDQGPQCLAAKNLAGHTPGEYARLQGNDGAFQCIQQQNVSTEEHYDDHPAVCRHNAPVSNAAEVTSRSQDTELTDKNNITTQQTRDSVIVSNHSVEPAESPPANSVDDTPSNSIVVTFSSEGSTKGTGNGSCSVSGYMDSASSPLATSQSAQSSTEPMPLDISPVRTVQDSDMTDKGCTCLTDHIDMHDFTADDQLNDDKTHGISKTVQHDEASQHLQSVQVEACCQELVTDTGQSSRDTSTESADDGSSMTGFVLRYMIAGVIMVAVVMVSASKVRTSPRKHF